MANYIETTYPWQRIKIPNIKSNGDLFCASTNDAIPVCLHLQNLETHQNIEISFSQKTPSNLFLAKGEYETHIYLGSRPQKFDLDSLSVRPIRVFEKLKLYAQKFYLALSRGASIFEIIGRFLKFNNIAKLNSQGINTATNASNIGPMLEFEIEKYHVNTSINKAPIFIEDWEIVANSDEILFDDALVLLEQCIARNANAKIIICNKIVNNNPICPPRFDPLLFEKELPTPYIKKKNYRPDFSSKWSQIDADFAKLDAIIAKSSRVFEPVSSKIADNCSTVSIIIPTRDAAQLLDDCLTGLFDKTNYPHEVFIIDNGSVENASFELFDKYREKGANVIAAPFEFNFSKLCNIGAREAKTENLLFLNNDIVIRDPDWLGKIIEMANNPNIGAIGATLLYQDESLQHGGVFTAIADGCGHLWSGIGKNDMAKMLQLACTSLRSAVTGACLFVSKENFLKVGGFDEDDFAITYNDVDLCLKLREKGLFIANIADTNILHLESKTRAHDTTKSQLKRRKGETNTFNNKWQRYLQKDEFLSDYYDKSSTNLKYK